MILKDIDLEKMKRDINIMVGKLPNKERAIFNKALKEIKRAIKEKDSDSLLKVMEEAKNHNTKKDA